MSSYEDESFPVAPFVIVVDRSGSMKKKNAIGQINAWLPNLVATLREIPEVEESASVGLASFAQKARVERDIDRIDSGVDLREFSAAGRTSYSAPLRCVREMIASDVPRLGTKGWRPVVFFITDGNPNCEDTATWMGAREQLLGKSFALRPKLVTLGFGSVDPDCLRALASAPTLARWENRPTQEALAAIIHTVLHTIITITGGRRASHSGAEEGDLPAQIFEFHYEAGEKEIIDYSPL